MLQREESRCNALYCGKEELEDLCSFVPLLSYIQCVVCGVREEAFTLFNALLYTILSTLCFSRAVVEILSFSGYSGCCFCLRHKFNVKINKGAGTWAAWGADRQGRGGGLPDSPLPGCRPHPWGLLDPLVCVFIVSPSPVHQSSVLLSTPNFWHHYEWPINIIFRLSSNQIKAN